MLPRHNRLKHQRDIEKVWKKGKTKAGKLIFLKVLKNDLDNSRFGFIVSTKISKKAVIRNKIKRQLREIVRENLPKIETGFDIIITAKLEILDKDFQQIKNELENLLQNI